MEILFLTLHTLNFLWICLMLFWVLFSDPAQEPPREP
jgi:hypothetical protein